MRFLFDSSGRRSTSRTKQSLLMDAFASLTPRVDFLRPQYGNFVYSTSFANVFPFFFFFLTKSTSTCSFPLVLRANRQRSRQIELSKASYLDIFAKFNVNWYVKCLIIENDGKLILMDSHAYSQPRLRYFRLNAAYEHAHVLTHQ